MGLLYGVNNIKRRRNIVGEIGERKVNKLLSKLNKGKYSIINNIKVPSRKGITQIDHVVISNFGVIVIETKNYKGIIYGDENKEYWYKNYYGRKNKFYSPILQNQGHINAIKNIIDDEEIPIYSIVVFISGCELDSKSNFSDDVIYEKELISRILQYKNKVMANKERKNIYNKIFKSSLDCSKVM